MLTAFLYHTNASPCSPLDSFNPPPHTHTHTLLPPPLQATPKMEVSSVVDSRTGQSKKSNVRTSTGAFFGRGYDDVIKRIEKRIAQVTMIPMGE